SAAMTAGSLYEVGGASAGFVTPTGLAVGPGGALTIADSGSCLVKQVQPASGAYTAAPTVVAGVTPASGPCTYGGDGGPATAANFNTPTGLSFDSSGNLLV